jgi:methanogenic corrinoid protein MtbC1
MVNELFRKMSWKIIDRDSDTASALAKEVVEAVIDPHEAINKGFMFGVNHVGKQISCGNTFLPKLVMAGEAMKTVVQELEPEMARIGSQCEIAG